MKRLVAVILVLVLISLAATPALAQSSRPTPVVRLPFSLTGQVTGVDSAAGNASDHYPIWAELLLENQPTDTTFAT